VHDGTLAALDAEVRVTFTEPMDRASVEAALSVSPPLPVTTRWAGTTLIVAPSDAWTSGATYDVAIDDAALSADGEPLGCGFSFFFRTAAAPGPISVPAGWTSYALPGDDLQVPLSLEAGRGALLGGRILLGDAGWDRVLLWGDRGLVQARITDDRIDRPSSMAQDVAGGAFAGDLLLTDPGELLRARLDGPDGGRVETVATLPLNANDWVVAVDPTGAFQGRAYIGRSGSGTVLAVDAAGTMTTFVTGVGPVRALAFGAGGAFGHDLYVLDGNGTLRRIDASGTASIFASHSLLSGAGSLAFDPVGSFGGNAFAVNPSASALVQVTGAGQVSTFGTGVGATPGPDALAFDALGDLHALVDTGGGTTVVKVVPSSTAVVVTDVPAPVVPGLVAVGPNPFAATTRLEYAVPAGGAPVRLAVHDVSGREVAVLVNGERPGGRNEETWDGRDAAGRRLASGVYFVRLTVAGREYTRKLTVLRP
jgi:hypothetical protein